MTMTGARARAAAEVAAAAAASLFLGRMLRMLLRGFSAFQFTGVNFGNASADRIVLIGYAENSGVAPAAPVIDAAGANITMTLSNSQSWDICWFVFCECTLWVRCDLYSRWWWRLERNCNSCWAIFTAKVVVVRPHPTTRRYIIQVKLSRLDRWLLR